MGNNSVTNHLLFVVMVGFSDTNVQRKSDIAKIPS